MQQTKRKFVFDLGQQPTWRISPQTWPSSSARSALGWFAYGRLPILTADPFRTRWGFWWGAAEHHQGSGDCANRTVQPSEGSCDCPGHREQPCWSPLIAGACSLERWSTQRPALRSI